MRALLDENIPLPALAALRVLEPVHTFDHVHTLGWDGTKDPELFRRASARGFEVLVALDRNQLHDAAEWRALKRARLHHVSVRQSRATEGAAGSLRLMASVLVAMPRVLSDLEQRNGGHVVEVRLLDNANRHVALSYKQHEQRVGLGG